MDDDISLDEHYDWYLWLDKLDAAGDAMLSVSHIGEAYCAWQAGRTPEEFRARFAEMVEQDRALTPG